MVKRIGIIGAGYAGVATARVLKAFGYDVVVWEKEPDIGGVWSSSRRYPGLTTQNPRDTYYLSELPMPKDWPEWPSGAQVQEYMEDYARKFDIWDNIKTNHEVVRAHLNSANGWTVHLADPTLPGGDGVRQEDVDFLIVCNGIFSKPFVPDYPGADEFTSQGGQILHTSEFTDQESARGKHVLIVGYGKSSCDVARAMLGVSASTTMVVRNLIWKIPKRVGGVLNFKHLFLSRMGEGLFKYIRLKGFERFLHSPVGRPIRNAMLGTVQGIVSAQLKLKRRGMHPNKPLETIARSTVSLVTEGFYEAIGAGDILVKKEQSIARLSPGSATLSSGETIPADVVVCGTGWTQEVPFFDSDIRARTNDEEGNFRLYRTMLPVGVPNLAFNGYNSSFFSQLNCEVGALWLAEYLHGGIPLPSVDDQNAHIDARLAWMKERTDGKHSKGTNIIPFSMHHVDELLDDISLNVGPLTRLGQWFTAVDPKAYRKLLRKQLRRHEKENKRAARRAQNGAENRHGARSVA